MLSVRAIDTYYGESQVLFGVSLHVARGEVVALLGPSGAGKTTTLRSILGLTPARSGAIEFEGRNVTRWPTFEIARLGLGWVPDDRRIAYSHEDTLMVMDLQTGEAARYRTPVKGQLVRTPAVSADGTKIIFQVFRHGAWLLDLADGSMQRVLADPTAEEFAWSPDGRRVAFHSRRDGQWGIYVLSRS